MVNALRGPTDQIRVLYFGTSDVDAYLTDMGVDPSVITDEEPVA